MGRGMEGGWRIAEEVDCMELWPGAFFQPHLEQPHFLLGCVVEDSIWNNDSVVKKEIENDWATSFLGFLVYSAA